MLPPRDKEDATDPGLTHWLLGAPQFWLGFVACATLVFLALLPRTLFPRKRAVVYSVTDRAPAPFSDPFHKPGNGTSMSTRTGTALLEHRKHLKETRPSYDSRRPTRPGNIAEARKRAVWHPHPDDDLPSWGAW